MRTIALIVAALALPPPGLMAGAVLSQINPINTAGPPSAPTLNSLGNPITIDIAGVGQTTATNYGLKRAAEVGDTRDRGAHLDPFENKAVVLGAIKPDLSARWPNILKRASWPELDRVAIAGTA